MKARVVGQAHVDDEAAGSARTGSDVHASKRELRAGFGLAAVRWHDGNGDVTPIPSKAFRNLWSLFSLSVASRVDASVPAAKGRGRLQVALARLAHVPAGSRLDDGLGT